MIDNGNPGIRTAVWRQMGTIYGGLAGHFIGQNMDLLILTLDKGFVTPWAAFNRKVNGQTDFYRLTLDVNDEQKDQVTRILQESGARWVEYEKGRLPEG
ncbi:MAG: hypothetical protein M0Z31_07930 [Clostridia bacterium]|nr:hypothetical protein [Clostridia bacterium]